MVLHLYGLHIPYHQDEYKWVGYSHDTGAEKGAVPHPPLTEFIYSTLGPIVGDNNFRLIPAGFGLVNLLLIFYLSKIIFDPSDKLKASKAALWTAFLFVISFYSFLASLMVDVDGAVMPMFFLIMAIGYFRLRKTNFQFSIFNFAILLIGAIGGFLVKVSAILPILAFALDFAILKGVFSDKKRILKYLGFGFIGLLGLILVLLGSKLIFPFFNLSYSLKYWEHFANSSSFFSRGWLQTFIQFAKSLMYTSPLLVLFAFLSGKEIFKKTRPLFIFISFGLLFYLFAFDFSLGALDRYFEFLVVPLCLIGGAVLAETSPLTPLLDKERGKRMKFFWGEVVIPAVFSITLFSFQFFIQFVPPLYPKTEWIKRVLYLKWNFLFPFTGGSGPTGFYVSFAFIALVWICSAIFAVFALYRPNFKKQAIIPILILGILYNIVFIEEYLFGKINGSPYGLFENAKTEIIKDSDIKNVVVYNDIGGYEIKQTGKYARRMYAAPQFESTYKEFFKDFSGSILYIDIPRIGENNFYSNYLASCKNIYERKDGYITAKIFKCNK